MKYFVLMLLLGMMVGFADVPVYGYFWLRYTYENPTTPEVDNNANYFSIERGYIRWKTTTTPVAVSATVDIAQKQNATSASDWNVRLKYAQADWTLPGISNSIPDAKLMLGLQKVYFGIMDLWEYPVIEKNLEEAESKTNSADLGIGFYGLIPNGFGEFSIQAFNGNGYTRVVENNTNKALCGNISIVPLPGVMLKGSYWMADQPTGDSIITQVTQDRYAGLLQVKYGPLTLIGEYLGTKDNETNGMGYMGFAEVAFNKKLSVLGRYDFFDGNTDQENDGHTRMIGGLNYKISGELLTQVNYQLTDYQDPDHESSDKIMVQFKYSY